MITRGATKAFGHFNSMSMPRYFVLEPKSKIVQYSATLYAIKTQNAIP